MGFWIFMLIVDLLIPAVMIVFGCYFAKNAPQEINLVFGYRTSRSMRNRDTWEFAHHYCGRVWRMIGWVMLVVSIIAMIFLIGKSTASVGAFGGILCSIQGIILILSTFPTELALKRTFDEQGKRKL